MEGLKHRLVVLTSIGLYAAYKLTMLYAITHFFCLFGLLSRVE